jgi:hypothetical protein
MWCRRAADCPGHQGYVSANFTDSRLNPSEANDNEIGSIELGVSIGVFNDDADGRARTDYLEQIIRELRST